MHNNVTTTGFINIIFKLLSESKQSLNGKTQEDIAEVLQWVEYAIVYAANVDSIQSINQVLTVSYSCFCLHYVLIKFILGT